MPVIHAHRGGALDFGKPVRPEDAMPAFRTAAAIPGTVLELDTVVTSDGVPVVIHDSSLDRTTDCAGNVIDRTVAEVEACRIDKLGVSANLVDAPAIPPLRIPRLAEVLAFAKAGGLTVNVEIKRIPGDAGYVPGDTGFATKVMEVVKAAALDPDKLIVQSFDPTNLDTARDVLPGVQLSFLTLAQANEGAPEFAAARGYQWVSPGGVPSASFLQRARSFGLKVVPYTLNTPEEVQAAAAAEVDAIITDDVLMARRALGLPELAASAPPRLTFPPRTRRSVLRGGGLRFRATAPVRLTVRLRGRVIARGEGQGAGVARLSAAGRRALRRRRGRVRLEVRYAFNGSIEERRVLTVR